MKTWSTALEIDLGCSENEWEAFLDAFVALLESQPPPLPEGMLVAGAIFSD